MSQSILLRSSEEYASLELKVRGLFNLGREVPLVVTFQLPQWMVETYGEAVPPHTLRTNGDIDMLLSVHEWNIEPKLCIVFGVREVAKYHYICRSPFTIVRRTYLGEGVTEEQHLATINVRDELREEVISEFNDPEKLMLMYRFSMEVEKARNSLDLNVDVEPNMDDHIVLNVDNPSVVNQPTADGYQFNGMGGFMGTPPVTVLRNTYAPSPYGGVMFVYVPHDETPYWEMRHGIYGVPGSEFTGYLPNDLSIVNSDDQQIPQHQISLDVSSTASSTELNTGVELRCPITNSTIGTGYKYGESSRRVIGEEDIKGEVQDMTDMTSQGAQRNANDVGDGTRGGEHGGK
ncbi:unnamed protein product [Eruca vesicaria subsp. sativa]|uniref:Uncharacterized protein n=1 Tax=Eruca vesicaria subsp. sativa TaxID=29727 RepID=A0ABC8LNZ4_ERUVS|nr:unnamed protein product [Eruca vesicaria subsp. sativa]